jgi:hypothetical protein
VCASAEIDPEPPLGGLTGDPGTGHSASRGADGSAPMHGRTAEGVHFAKADIGTGTVLRQPRVENGDGWSDSVPLRSTATRSTSARNDKARTKNVTVVKPCSDALMARCLQCRQIERCRATLVRAAGARRRRGAPRFCDGRRNSKRPAALAKKRGQADRRGRKVTAAGADDAELTAHRRGVQL